MSSTYTVTVDIDVANQTVTASDNSVTVPTSNFEIVTFDGKSCIRANSWDYATFVFGENIESFTCKIFLQSVVDFTLFVEVDSANNTKYSLVYHPYGEWYNPDRTVVDRNQVLIGVWVTVTYSNSNKTLTFDNGSTQLTRSLDNYLVDLSIGSYNNRYNVYLTDLEFEVSIPSSKYLNATGLSEVWTNTKNYVSAQLLGKSDVGHTHSASDITSGLSTVATSGSYNDLSNKPTIPSKISDLTNDSGFITSDNTKIPLAGSNAISGSLIPSTDNSIDIGSSTNNIKTLYTKGITINGTQFLPSDYVTLNDAQTIPGNKTFSGIIKTTGKYPYSYSGNDLNNAIYNIETTYWGPDTANRPSSSDYGTLLSFNREVNDHTSNEVGWMAQFGIGTNLRLYLRTKTNLGGVWEPWKEFITINEAVPRSGGAVMTGNSFYRTTGDDYLVFSGGTGWQSGGGIALYGPNITSVPGVVQLLASLSPDNNRIMVLYPNGTWTWNGTACQITSDQRFKQQISEIDDDLLTAWEDVEPVQFKYNDAVEEKGDTARLHAGYVVQQIDEACKKHNVDVSKYGLYCHEEYAEETREVEHEDGTKTTEVVRPASEHYSLRYTEALIVECAYLRKKLKELTARIEQLEKGNNTK